jgi:hypothetical protein
MRKSVHPLLETIWSDLRTVSKTVGTIQSRVRKLPSEYVVIFCIELFTTTIGVIVTLMAVGYAFRLDQQAVDTATTERLHLAVFESEGNREVVTNIFKDFQDFSNDTELYSIRIKRPDTSMAALALSDPNTTELLSPYKFSLLVLYTETHVELNHALDLYHEYTLAGSLQTSKNEGVFSRNQQEFSETIIGKAALAAITCDYLEDLLPAYSDQYPYDPNDPYDEQRIGKAEEDIECKLTQIMSGTVSIDSPLGPTSVLTPTLTACPTPSRP